MKQPRGVQTRILSLIDGYQTAYGGDDDPGSKQGHLSRMISEMSKRPGHWFLIGQRGRVNGVDVRLGTMSTRLKVHGLEAAEVDGKQYARVPHECGIPISSLVTKQKPLTAADALPEVKAIHFGWSQDELRQAAATARDWLFPTEGIAA